MNALEALAPGISVLGWCLVHFLWQAVVVGVLYVLARVVLPRGNPRYLVAMLAMLALILIPVATAWHEWQAYATPADLAGMLVTGVQAAAPTSTPAEPAWMGWLNSALPWLVLAWALGVGVLGVRVFRQWRGLRALLRSAESLPEWQARARAFADRLGLRRAVPVLASVRIATPALVGWVRPAVVLPLAVLARMPMAQVDLILAHELAHLRRCDHLANLFQVVVETLFFYHPVVHWISRDARNERELCCDALALRVTHGERREFVAALASLEELRAGHADLALAASGGVLAERAWFIAGAASQRSRWHLRGNTLVVVLMATVLALGGLWWHDAAWQQQVASLMAANNASVLRWIRQDVVQAPGLASVSREPGRPRLLPLPYASVSGQADVAPAQETPVRIGPIANATLILTATVAHPLTSITMPDLSIRTPESTAVVAASAAPRPLRTVQPVYPSQALLAGTQGQVVVEFALTAAGVPHDLEVVGSSAGPFDVAALQALSGWRFAPPAAPGRRYRQAFTFRLGSETAGDAATARDCLILTGTHICRHATGDAAGVRELGPNH